MNNKNMIIAAVVVALVALVSFNLENITGNPIQTKASQPIIKVLSQTIERGEQPQFEIYFKKGDACIWQEVHFSRYNEKYKTKGIKISTQKMDPLGQDFDSGVQHSSYKYCPGDFKNNRYIFTPKNSPLTWKSGETYEAVFYYYPESVGGKEIGKAITKQEIEKPIRFRVI
tara:strand:+ start:342 stop:854 length:513 start_codon:yes stop_codon:yes gene_type:complete